MEVITKKTKNVNLKGWHYLNPEDALTRKQKKRIDLTNQFSKTSTTIPMKKKK